MVGLASGDGVHPATVRSLPLMRAAVDLNAGRALLEASGGVDMTSVKAIAQTGVDRISIGSLTKDIRAIDYSLRIISA